MYSSMASATRLDTFTASTTVFAPVTTSPDAYTPGRVVLPLSSTAIRPLPFTSMPLVEETITERGP